MARYDDLESSVDSGLPAASNNCAWCAASVLVTSDAVGEFHHGDNANGNSFVAGFQRDGFQKLPGVLALPFGGNSRCRVEH